MGSQEKEIKKSQKKTTADIETLQDQVKDLHKQLELYQIKEALCKRVHNQLKFGTFDWDINSDNLTWTTGFNPTGINGKSSQLLKKIVHPQDYKYVMTRIQNFLVSKKPDSIEFQSIAPDKSIHHLRLEADIILDGNKKPATIFGTYYDITEFKQALEQKKETEEQFKLFMNHIPGAAFIKDENNVLVYCNNTFAAMVSKTPEDLIGHDITKFIPPANEQEFILENNQVIKGKKVLELEHTYPDPDGDTHWLTFKFPIIRANNSVQVGSLSFDVTESKQAQAQLSKRESRLQSIFRASPVGIGLVSDRKLLQVNNIICEMTGHTQEELIGQSARVLYPSQEEYEWVGREKYEQIREKGTGTVETVWKRKDGSLIDVLLSSTPLNFQDLTEGVTFTALDITERKKAEKELKDSQRTLSTLFHNLPGMAYRCKNDNYWTMEFISSGCSKLTGYTPNDLLFNKNQSYAEIIYPDDRDMVDNIIYEAIQGKEHFELEYRIITADNQIKNVLERGVGIYTDNGELSHLEGFITDITAKKQAELLLQNELIEKEVLLKEIHHRVKNNLQIIISLLNMQSNRNQDPYVKEALHECTNRIHSMALVHEKMYRSSSFAKINFKEYMSSIAREVFHANQVGDHITYKLVLDDIHLELSKAIPCGLIVNELINNAFKHAFPNQSKGKLDIKTEINTEKNCVITIKDNGVGLPPDIDFQTVDSMGFILVRVLSRQLDGNLELCSSSKGSCFKLTFPF